MPHLYLSISHLSIPAHCRLCGPGWCRVSPPPPTSGTNSFARGAVWAGRGAAPVPQLMKGQWVASQKLHPTASTHNSTSAASISAPGASREGATSTLTPHRAAADPHFMPSAQLSQLFPFLRAWLAAPGHAASAWGPGWVSRPCSKRPGSRRRKRGSAKAVRSMG